MRFYVTFEQRARLFFFVRKSLKQVNRYRLYNYMRLTATVNCKEVCVSALGCQEITIFSFSVLCCRVSNAIFFLLFLPLLYTVRGKRFLPVSCSLP